MTYTVAEYIWLDSNKKFRSKTKVIKCEKIGENKYHGPQHCRVQWRPLF